jgi:hypothetical protein
MRLMKSSVLIIVCIVIMTFNTSCRKRLIETERDYKPKTNSAVVTDGRAKTLSSLKSGSNYLMIKPSEEGDMVIVNSSGDIGRLKRGLDGKDFDLFFEEGAEAIFVIEHKHFDFEKIRDKSVIDYLPVYDGRVQFTFSETPFEYSIDELFLGVQ